MGARLYSSTTARFLSIDPVPGGSANRYDYCNQDPVNQFDLLGEASGWGPWITAYYYFAAATRWYKPVDGSSIFSRIVSWFTFLRAGGIIYLTKMEFRLKTRIARMYSQLANSGWRKWANVYAGTYGQMHIQVGYLIFFRADHYSGWEKWY